MLTCGQLSIPNENVTKREMKIENQLAQKIVKTCNLSRAVHTMCMQRSVHDVHSIITFNGFDYSGYTCTVSVYSMNGPLRQP